MPLDPETVQVLQSLPSGKGGSLMADLARIFLGDLPGRKSLLLEAYQVRDGRALARVAHLLKGSCSAIGALPLAELCGQLESAGSREDWAAVMDFEARFEALEREVREDLHPFLG